MGSRDIRLISAGAALAALSLAACTDFPDGQGLSAATTFAGMSRETLLSCAGEPQRTETVDGVERFTYVGEGVAGLPTPDFIAPGFNYQVPGDASPYGTGLGYGGFGAPILTCEATFTLKDGVVQQLIFAGASGQSRCYPILRNCLALLPR